MVDRDAGTETERAFKDTANQVKDAAHGMADNLADAGSAAYDQGSELVVKNPGSALLMAGFIGFALGVILTKGSQPPRNRLQRYYDRYSR
ncbi:hypothetical protein V4R08_17945 (plasmid) [Nitrobacter sp. NHB1]|uniref:hypothetical protein n=1 Tax=Nitrobacter sp. NHB1 TaxID=3119830 RepID=UPI002FFED387